MTNILSVEEVADDFGEQFDELKMKPHKPSMPGLERELLKDFMRKALTEDRTALLKEERKRVHELLQDNNWPGELNEHTNKIIKSIQQTLTPTD